MGFSSKVSWLPADAPCQYLPCSTGPYSRLTLRWTFEHDSSAMSSTPTSDASTKIGSDSAISDEEKSLSRRAFERAQRAATSQDILLFLVAFRILNALSIRTFFQPDEFFQSLEPAWAIAFGEGSGAWITWVSWANSFTTGFAPTGSTGMETPAPVRHTSYNLRGLLLACIKPLEGPATASQLACRPHHSCAENGSSGLCGAR